MDYPMLVPSLNQYGEVTLAAAYEHGIGEWDKFAVRYCRCAYPTHTPTHPSAPRLASPCLRCLANTRAIKHRALSPLPALYS